MSVGIIVTEMPCRVVARAQLWKDFPLPIFGLAQVALAMALAPSTVAEGPKRMEEARRALVNVCALVPDDRDTLRLLATVYTLKLEVKEARAMLKRVTELYPEDADGWAELGMLLQREHSTRDVESARIAYERAISLMVKQKRAVPMEMYSNLAVIFARTGDAAKAEKFYLVALHQLAATRGLPRGEDASLDAVMTDAVAVTTTYNLARAREALGRIDAASALYKRILEAHPGYVDAALRLGVMARNAGRVDEAIKLFTDAGDRAAAAAGGGGGGGAASRGAVSASGAVDARLLLAQLMEATGQAERAGELVQRVLDDQTFKHDAYARLMLGNALFAPAAGQELVAAAASCAMARAQYRGVLTVHPSNVYAANGIGMSLGEEGEIASAVEVFQGVREHALEVPVLWINLACACLAQRRVDEAVQMYANCLKKFYSGRDVSLLALLARALYDGKVCMRVCVCGGGGGGHALYPAVVAAAFR